MRVIPGYIIDNIKQREEKERVRETGTPLYQEVPSPPPPSYDNKSSSGRGVVEVDFTVPTTNVPFGNCGIETIL